MTVGYRTLNQVLMSTITVVPRVVFFTEANQHCSTTEYTAVDLDNVPYFYR